MSPLQETDQAVLTKLAMAHHQAGRLLEAETGYLTLLKHNPDDPSLLHNLGVLAAEQERTEDAVDYFNRALSIVPDYVSAHFNKGVALRSLGRSKDALQSFRRTTALDPGFYEAHLALANLWMSEGRCDRALDHFARILELRRGEDRTGIVADSMKTTTRLKLRHDADQLRHISKGHWDAERFAALARTYDAIADKISPNYKNNEEIELTVDQLSDLGGSYNSPYALADAPELSSGTLNSELDLTGIQNQYLNSIPGVAWFDDLLQLKALELLQRYLLKSTIWCDFTHIGGCLATYLEDGLACPLILQIADDLRAAFPEILGDLSLKQIWAFKAIDTETHTGIDVHADDGVVSVNFWMTPDAANEMPGHSGLIVHRMPPPARWEINDYSSDLIKIRNFLKKNDSETITVPYKQNRAVIFESRLFHESDFTKFQPGYKNHRINLTILFGDKV